MASGGLQIAIFFANFAMPAIFQGIPFVLPVVGNGKNTNNPY